jgi:carbon starvation protein
MRFMIQDYVGAAIPAFKATESWANNLVGSALACAMWGYLLYAGVVDPYGGIWTMWPLFGATNQMLAAIALTLCTVVLFKMKRDRFAFVTVVPAVWLLICTLTAGLEKVFSPDPAVGFLSHAARFNAASAAGTVLAPVTTLEQMGRVIFNDYLDAGLAALAVAIVFVVAICAIIEIVKAKASPKSTAIEVGGAVATGSA